MPNYDLVPVIHANSRAHRVERAAAAETVAADWFVVRPRTPSRPVPSDTAADVQLGGRETGSRPWRRTMLGDQGRQSDNWRVGDGQGKANRKP